MGGSVSRLASRKRLAAAGHRRCRSVWVLLLICLAGTGPRALPAVEPAADVLGRTELPLKTPRTRDPVLGGKRETVFVTVWLPAGVGEVRGAVCNPFAKGEPPSAHWQAACRHWKFAYVQTDFDGAKQDEYPLLYEGLARLAKELQRPELATMPVCYTGMSRGGGMSMQLTELTPARTLAAAPVCLEVGPSTPAARAVPVVTIFGEKDGQQMVRLLGKLPLERAEGARWAIAVQWNRRHEFGQANNLTFPVFDDVIRRRLPEQPGQPLRDFPLDEGWYGAPGQWSKSGAAPQVFPVRGFAGDPRGLCWLPSERSAAVWRAFVSGTPAVKLAAPAGLGDGQAFVLHPAGQPIAVRVEVAAAKQPLRVELWNAHQKLAVRETQPWEFSAELPSGIHTLIAVVHEAAGAANSRPHTLVVGPEN